jgi:hypothetical protein
MSDLGSTRWFGQSWGAPVCDPATKTAIPLDHLCDQCGLKFLVTDRGLLVRSLGPEPYVYYHFDCFMGIVLGPTLADRVVDYINL